VGGTADILDDGKNGIIINVNDPNMLAGRIRESLDDTEKRMTLGKNARQSIVERFTPERELEANLDIYRKLGIS
jgi:glycosyltransferase involved in cell wall biosynthesis